MVNMIKQQIRILLLLTLSCYSIAYGQARHAMTLYDEPPKYKANFTHFDYVNPDAPKGGVLRLSSYGGFDTLNGFGAKGNPASYLTLLHSTLTVRSQDEPNTAYGLIAEKIQKAKDNSWVRFYLRKNAKFNDGHPITADDVVFTFNILKEKGSPFYRNYYADVDTVIAENKQQVMFKFKNNNNRELPMIIGELPVLPKHWWQDKDFNGTKLTAPLGSGPYRVSKVNAGSSIEFERVNDWWAKDLPTTKGFYNFDKVIVDYYRDLSVTLEAFKANQFDFIQEYSAKNWATGYDSPALHSNEIIKKELQNHNPAPVQAFIFNLRRPMFQDVKVRQAISLLFDFEWSNRQLFFNSYKRIGSYFENSEMAAHDLPNEAELAILEPYRDQLPDEVFTQVFKPATAGTRGLIREQQRKAYKLLEEAGYQLKNNKLVDPQGNPLKFEFLLAQTQLERVLLPFKANLADIGIDMEIRRVDTAQFINRLRSKDYDMISYIWGQSNSPGNEQLNYWHSSNKDVNGSMNNVMGIDNPVVDALIEKLIKANSRQELITHTKALDRVLQWQHYLIFNYYTDKWRIAYWNKFGQPTKAPDYDIGLFTWWALPTEPIDNQTTSQQVPVTKR